MSDAVGLPVKTAKPNLSLYALLCCFVLVLVFTIFSGLIPANLYKAVNLGLLAVFVAIHYGILIGLTFETFRRYSRFGVSNTKNTLNHVLSVTLIALPFVSIVIPFLMIPSLLMLALSKYRSPDDVRERSLPFHDRPGFIELTNAVLWGCTVIILFF